MDTYFEKVEKVLSKFPLDCRKNYDENKQTLKINLSKPIMNKLYGTYDHEENIIDLYLEDALPHELFHMAFRDGNKVGLKIWEDEDMVYENGVSFSFMCNGSKVIYGRGITEGFAEWLARLCTDYKGKSFQYYFMDLLISIYGEDIIEYALRNDTVGFYGDERFHDIHKFSRELDELENYTKGISLISEFRDIYNGIFENGSIEDKQRCAKLITEVRFGIKNSLVELFKLILLEYEYCDSPKISFNEFYNKLEVFLINSDYSFIFYLDDKCFSVKKEIEDMIKIFYRKNKIFRRIKKH